MTSRLLKPFDRLVNRASRRVLNRLRGDSFNIIDAAFLKAAMESADYYMSRMTKALLCEDLFELISHGLSLAKPNGLCLEFGVATGTSISHIGSHWHGPVYGFDSFEGLPEDWYGQYKAGHFSGDMPRVPGNVSLIKGWFSDTLPKFVADHGGPVSFLHVDCDLYSSTRSIFESLGSQIQPGCVIVFDEYFNYPGWKHHEHLAFQEFAQSKQLAYRYEALVPSHQQVCVVIESSKET
jgi:hypothetical protein